MRSVRRTCGAAAGRSLEQLLEALVVLRRCRCPVAGGRRPPPVTRRSGCGRSSSRAPSSVGPSRDLVPHRSGEQRRVPGLPPYAAWTTLPRAGSRGAPPPPRRSPRTGCRRLVAEQDDAASASVGRRGEPRAERRRLPLARTVVHDEARSGRGSAARTASGVAAQDDDDLVDRRAERGVQHVLERRAAGERKQQLGAAHPGRRAGRQDDPGDHALGAAEAGSSSAAWGRSWMGPVRSFRNPAAALVSDGQDLADDRPGDLLGSLAAQVEAGRASGRRCRSSGSGSYPSRAQLGEQRGRSARSGRASRCRGRASRGASEGSPCPAGSCGSSPRRTCGGRCRRALGRRAGSATRTKPVASGKRSRVRNDLAVVDHLDPPAQPGREPHQRDGVVAGAAHEQPDRGDERLDEHPHAFGRRDHP